VKPRLPVEVILHQDVYRDPNPELIRSYDEVMAEYYRARGNNARRSDWSATTARAVQGKKREHLLPFLHRMGLFLR
jgi:nitroreductase